MKFSQREVLKKVRKPMPRPTRKEESKRVKEARKRRYADVLDYERSPLGVISVNC